MLFYLILYRLSRIFCRTAHRKVYFCSGLFNFASHLETYDKDRALAAGIKKGDRKAFTVLFEKYTDRIFYTCLKSGLSREDAEGICQEVFIKIWEKRTDIKEDLSISGYLFTITKNQILKLLRSEAYALALKKYWKTTHEEASAITEHEILTKDLEKTVYSYIRQLPEKQQEVLMLKVMEGLTNDEIAERLGLSKRTVENQVYRSLKKIRSFLDNNQLLDFSLLLMFLLH